MALLCVEKRHGFLLAEIFLAARTVGLSLIKNTVIPTGASRSEA